MVKRDEISVTHTPPPITGNLLPSQSSQTTSSSSFLKLWSSSPQVALPNTGARERRIMQYFVGPSARGVCSEDV
jgi:hypothetical protein